MSTIDDFVNSSDELISATAKLGVSYQAALANKQITQSEYNEFVIDLLDLNKLDMIALSQERKQHVYSAMATLASFLGVRDLLKR